MKTTEPNDPKLCLLVAGLLTQQLSVKAELAQTTPTIRWNDGCRLLVGDREWLYVAQLAEESLTEVEHAVYREHLAHICMPQRFSPDANSIGYLMAAERAYASATFNQRAAAICAAKGLRV